MSRAWFTATRRPNARGRGRGVVGAALVSIFVATSSLTVVIAPRPAAADQIGDLKAQARAISQKLVQDQLQIDAYQQQYSVISAKIAADAQAIAQLGQQIDGDEAQTNKDTLEVRQLAITSYMNGGVLAGADASLFSGNSEEVQSAKEYDSIATGDIDTALDQLQAAQQTLEANQAALRQQQAQDQSNQAQQAAALSQANATQYAMELEQAQVTGQLATAVAAQAAAQDEAAAAAVSKAQKVGKSGSGKGGSGTASGIVPGTGSDAGAPPDISIPDPALNPFLQCVVQAESRGNYQAVSPNGLYMGAFQFSQSTWNLAALSAALSILVNVPPNRATKAEQDTLAVVLYSLDGERPWLGDRCSS